MRRPASLTVNVDLYEAEINKDEMRVYTRKQQNLLSETNTDEDLQLVLDVNRIDRPKLVAPPIANHVYGPAIRHGGDAGRRSGNSEIKSTEIDEGKQCGAVKKPNHILNKFGSGSETPFNTRICNTVKSAASNQSHSESLAVQNNFSHRPSMTDSPVKK